MTFSEFPDSELSLLSNSFNCLTTISQNTFSGSNVWYEVDIFKLIGFKFRWGSCDFKSSIFLLGKCFPTKTLSFVHEFCHLFIIIDFYSSVLGIFSLFDLLHFIYCFDICSSVLLTIYASESSEIESHSFSISCNCLTTISQKPSWGSKNLYEVAIFKQVGFKYRWGRCNSKSSIPLAGKWLQTKTLSFVHEFWYLFMSFAICSSVLIFVHLFWHFFISWCIMYTLFSVLTYVHQFYWVFMLQNPLNLNLIHFQTVATAWQQFLKNHPGVQRIGMKWLFSTRVDSNVDEVGVILNLQ